MYVGHPISLNEYINTYCEYIHLMYEYNRTGSTRWPYWAFQGSLCDPERPEAMNRLFEIARSRSSLPARKHALQSKRRSAGKGTQMGQISDVRFESSAYLQNALAIIICLGVLHSGCSRPGLPTRIHIARALDVATLNLFGL